jgi:hypothetical protein
MRLVFAGTPEFAAPALEALHQAGYNIVGVYTQPDRPAGRGQKLTPSPVARRAAALNLPVFKPEKFTPPAIEQLRALAADAMVAGSFVTLARKCGKPTCRCARGEKHEGKYLSRSEGGRTRLAYVPAGDEVDVATKAERYRRFRQARAALMKLADETAEAADVLQASLTEPYPKEARRRRRRR